MTHSTDTLSADTAIADTSPQGSQRPAFLAIARWLLVVALVFAGLAAGLGWASRSLPAGSASGAVGAARGLDLPPADFRLASLDGRELGPRDFLGKMVVIDFWATWCGPCRLQAAYLDKLHKELSADDVQFLAISLGEDEETVRRFTEGSPFPYPVLIDPDDEITQRYRIFGLPTVMVIDRKGAIRYMESSVIDADSLRREISRADA